MRLIREGMAYSSSKPKQIEDLLNHLNNGESLNSFDIDGWEEVEDPDPNDVLQDGWPPFGNINYKGLEANQKALKEYSKKVKAIPSIAKDALIKKVKLKSLDALYKWAVLTGAHAVSVKVGGGVGYGAAEGGSYELILILQGPYAGSFVGTRNRSRGIGAIYATLDGTCTTYTFDGKLTDLTPDIFEGSSLQSEVGGKFIGGASVSGSWARVEGGKLYSRSISFGLGLGVSVSFQVEQSEIIYK